MGGVALLALVVFPAVRRNQVNQWRMSRSKKESRGARSTRRKGEEFLAENKKKPGVKTTESGLQYLVLKEGTGKKPELDDNVLCHYHGTLIDGTVFDSSVDRGAPISFPVNRRHSRLDRGAATDERGLEVAGLYSVEARLRQRGARPKSVPTKP